LSERFAQLQCPALIFQEVQDKIRETMAEEDEIVDIEHEDLDIGEVLGVQFADNDQSSENIAGTVTHRLRKRPLSHEYSRAWL
jgi:regulator of sigma D